MIRVYSNKQASAHCGQQPGTKSIRGPADKPRVNRILFPPSVYIGFRLFVLPKGHPGQMSSMPWGARGMVDSWANRSVGGPFCHAPPRPAALPCAALPRPTRALSGFWIRRIFF